MALPDVYTPAHIAAHLGVSEYYVKRTARRHGIGKVIARQRRFTEADVQEFLRVHEAAQQPKPSRAPKEKQPRALKPKTALPPTPDGVTVLRSRPERARSYGRSA